VTPPATGPGDADPGASAPSGLLGALHDQLPALRRVVAARRADWDGADGGTFADLVDRTLAELDVALLAGATTGGLPPDELDLLVQLLGLTPFERQVLVAALAPSVDPRFAAVYAWLHGDPTRTLLSVGLALELGGLDPWHPVARRQLGPDGTLVAAGLLALDDAQPSHRRSLVAPDRLVAHLLGDDELPALVARVVGGGGTVSHEAVDGVVRLLEAGEWFTYLHGPGDSGAGIALAAAERWGLGVLEVDLERLPGLGALEDVIAAAHLEALLRRSALVLGPIDVAPPERRGVLDRLSTAPVPVFLHGRATWDPGWARISPAVLDASPLGLPERRTAWAAVLEAADIDLDPSIPASIYHLAPARIAAAVRAATLDAVARDADEVDLAAISHGVRTQNSVSLERLARRIAPSARFEDVIVSERTLAQLYELVVWAAQRDHLIDELGVRGKGTKGRGLTGLFVGPSGTGKTLAAEVVAAELGLDLYVIDLSTVVSKYIGETEENLDRVFREATGVNGVLFFDEADALFGKRSDVSDSKDRYANMEVAYLLQRMEQFDGISLLASNLRANLDEAFTRRLDQIITFPAPSAEQRARIWDVHLPPTIERADDIDLTALGERFTLSGGEIANAARAAAHTAVREDGVLTMRILVDAVAREYDKIGRLIRHENFGPWMDDE
jgi:ATP-dependent 26S proteasome regulatory subunit